jgi:hypothetical protein
MDKAFPGFWDADASSEDFRKQRAQLQKFRVDHILIDTHTPRRFVGGWNLPRGRYFSLCHDEAGDDQLTLTNEFCAYFDPLRAGIVMIFDTGTLEGFAALKKNFDDAEPGPHITAILIGRPGLINPVIDALDQAGLIPQEANTQGEDRCFLSFEFPYRVDLLEIHNVFDLRRPECQEYVVEEFFKKDTEQLKKKDRSGVASFVEALPVLMNPEVGGGHIVNSEHGPKLQALAAFLRSQGCEALIYPSARSDVLGEVRDRSINRWRGWCLVDYRGADGPEIAGLLDLSPGWTTRFPSGAQIRFASNGEFAGSFEVTGIAKWNRERITDGERKFVEAQSLP